MSSLSAAIDILSFFHKTGATDSAINCSNRKRFEAGGLSSLSTTIDQAASPALRAAKPIGAEHPASWVKYWISTGFLPS